MVANRSAAVMQQRREPDASLDDFPTAPWATRALIHWLRTHLVVPTELQSVREPAANRGHMVRPLLESFREVVASDIHDYGAGFPLVDYLFGLDDWIEETDWTITNPPFKLAEQFIARALERSKVGVAMIVRSAFLEGGDRYRSLFHVKPPTHILQFTERVVMLKGRLVRTGALDDKNLDERGQPKRATSATAYSWLVWIKGRPRPTEFHWIPPSRLQHERPGDYPEESSDRANIEPDPDPVSGVPRGGAAGDPGESLRRLC